MPTKGGNVNLKNILLVERKNILLFYCVKAFLRNALQFSNVNKLRVATIFAFILTKMPLFRPLINRPDVAGAVL